MISFTLYPSTVDISSQATVDLLTNGADIDLTTPESLATFYALILPGNGNLYAVSQVTIDSSELIRLSQQTMVDVIGAVDQQYSPMLVDGTYGCESSTTMLRIAQLLGEDIGDQTDWPLGRREFVYLIGQCKDFQDQSKQQLQPLLGFPMDGVIPILSSDPNVGRFVAAMPPSDCSPAHLHLEDTPAPSTGIDTISYIKGVEGAGVPSNSDSGLGFWSGTMIGIVAAVGSAAAYGYWKGHHQ